MKKCKRGWSYTVKIYYKEFLIQNLFTAEIKGKKISIKYLSYKIKNKFLLNIQFVLLMMNKKAWLHRTKMSEIFFFKTKTWILMLINCWFFLFLFRSFFCCISIEFRLLKLWNCRYGKETYYFSFFTSI